LFWICLQQFFRAGANRFFDTWLPTYLQEARGGSVADAGLLSSIPLWAGVFGGVVGGTASDAILASTRSRWLARNGVAIGSQLAGLACFVSAYFIPDVRLAIWVLGAGAFLVTFAAPCAYALTMDVGGRHLGVVFGTMNMVGNLGSWAFSRFIPRLVTWSGDWGPALAVFAAMHLASVLCWLVLNPNGVIGQCRAPRPQEPSP
jgi:ACS family glucarate transporter-like MFS transporter